MTVVLALRCADGVVLGSDSQITDGARGLSYPAQKLHPFGDSAAWGGSGSRAVLYDLEQMFDGCAAAVLGAENIGHAVQERVVPVLRRHYDQFVEQVPGEKQSGATPATYVLAAGFAEGEPFIVDIDPHGLIGRYEEVGFHAVGSGAAMAQQAGALLAHFRMTERDVDYGVVAVVRILDTLRDHLAEHRRPQRRLPDHRRGGHRPVRQGHRPGAQAGRALVRSGEQGARRALRRLKPVPSSCDRVCA